MKPIYRIKYNFPNDRIKDKYCNDVENLMSPYDIYKKYGKYRDLEKWEDFEEGYITRLNFIDKECPEIGKITHLILYDGIYVGNIRLGQYAHNEELLKYVKYNYDKVIHHHIDNMQIEKLSIVEFDYKYECNVKIETKYNSI